MDLLIDTQILIWLGQGSPRLSRKATALLEDDRHLLFSPLNVVEVAVKRAKGFADFQIDPVEFRTSLLASKFIELPLTGAHAVRLRDLPPIHKDPFDRLLVAQALAEGIAFLTADAMLGAYPGRVMVV